MLPRRPLLFEIPRGEHQFALTCSLFLQVARLEERALHPGHGLDFRGPIVVIALDRHAFRSVSLKSVSKGLASEKVSSNRRAFALMDE